MAEETLTPAAPVVADNLDALESEAIHIIREVAGEFDRPVIRKVKTDKPGSEGFKAKV